MVRITILGINSIANKGAALLANPTVFSSDKAEKSSTIVTTKYDPAHPPEVFFGQEDENTMLHTFLLNFVPSDPGKETGKDGIWTGKLYEWNMAGDTLAVQEIVKSKLNARYGLRLKKATIAQPNDKAVNGNWSDFWNGIGAALSEFVAWVGDLFGASWYNNTLHKWELYGIDWDAIGSFFDGIFEGNGGNTTSGGIIYSNFMPGYNPPGPTPGGLPPDGGWNTYTGGPSNNISAYSSAIYLKSKLSLTPEEEEFLFTRTDIADALQIYLVENFETGNAKDFLNWAVEYLHENIDEIDFTDFKNDFLVGDAGLNISDIGTDGSGQNMNYSIYFDNVDGYFKLILKNDPDYNNVINNGTTSLPIDFTPCTTQALRQMGKSKGWDVGVSSLEFNRWVGQAFQEATYKLYREKLNPLQRSRVEYQPQNLRSPYRAIVNPTTSQGKVILDWTYDVAFMGTAVTHPQHMFYDAKAVNGTLYLSSSKFQIAGYIDALSRKKNLKWATSRYGVCDTCKHSY